MPEDGIPAQPLPDTDESGEAADSSPDLYWTAPEEFLSLGVTYDDAEREAKLEVLAEQIFPGGSDEQVDQLIGWYREVAAAASADGAEYAGICIVGAEDDRACTASLTARCTPADSADPDLAARSLLEMLSIRESQEAHRVDSANGPAVLVISGFELDPGAAEATDAATASAPPAPIHFARIEVYLPLPTLAHLLVFSLTTPSLHAIPWFVSRLSEVVDTVEVAPVQHSAERSATSTAADSKAPASSSPISTFIR